MSRQKKPKLDGNLGSASDFTLFYYLLCSRQFEVTYMGIFEQSSVFNVYYSDLAEL